MLIFSKRSELLDFADEKGLPGVFDLLDQILPTKQALACTDGERIYVNIDDFNELSAQDQFFVLSHELLHITYQHHKMQSIYNDKELLNICQDIVINEYLYKKLKYRPNFGVFFDSMRDLLKSWGCISTDISYSGVLTTRALYRFLKQYRDNQDFGDWVSGYNSDQIKNDQDSNSSKSENKESSSSKITKELIAELRDSLKVTDKILSNENMAISIEDIKETSFESKKEFGYGDGQLTRVSNGTVKTVSKLDIIKYIKQFIGDNAVIKGRSRTYSRPSRRFNSKDLVIKGYRNTKTITKIYVYLDTSGSMDRNFVMDMFTTLKVLNQTTDFDLYTFDTGVHSVNLKKDDSIYCSGGTNINNVLNHIKENNHDVSILITDCEDNFNLDNTHTDVMIFTNNKNFKSTNNNVKVTYWD